MSEKPERFFVSLTVNLAVFARDQTEAQRTAQGWLQRTVSRASVVEPNLVVTYEPRVAATSSSRTTGEHLFPVQDRETQNSAEIAAARSRSDYVELVNRLKKAETTEDYLLVRQDVRHWNETGDQFYGIPLVQIGEVLDTLAEAMRWSESHPNGPMVWNMGGLFASIKRAVNKEYQAVNGRHGNRQAHRKVTE